MWITAKAGAKPDAPLNAPLLDAELRELLSRVAERDRTAFRCLYHALRPALARHLHRLLPRTDLVDELLNDVMYVVWQNAGDFRGDAQVTTWVLGIATLKSLRARQRWQRDRALLDHPVMEMAATQNADADRDLADGLAQLSVDHRDTLELTYYFGYSCAEVAKLQGCPVGTVKTRLFHARRRLKHFLEQCVSEAT